MTNRVVLGAFDGTYVLRASVPGANVLSTSLAENSLAFDSRWQGAANVLATGSAQMKHYVGDLTYYWTATITIAAGLARPPIVVGMIRHQTTTNLFTPNYQGVNYNKSTGALSMAGFWEPWDIPSPYRVETDWGYYCYVVLRG